MKTSFASRLQCLALATVLSLGASTQTMAQQRHSDNLDDVLQYSPYAAVLALKTCGVESRDAWPQLIATTAASWVMAAGVGYTLKHTVKEWRPDDTDQKSFPSGHAMFAFAGATALHKEFGHVSPWISVAGYSVATFVAVDRVLRDRHHWYDAAAGAALGFATTELTWWLSDKVFGTDKKVAVALTGNGCLDVAIRW